MPPTVCTIMSTFLSQFKNKAYALINVAVLYSTVFMLCLEDVLHVRIPNTHTHVTCLLKVNVTYYLKYGQLASIFCLES